MESRKEVYRQELFRAMNTECEAVLAVPGADRDERLVRVWMNEVKHWFWYVERTFSRFDPGSELSRLNRTNGKPMLVSDTMLEVLRMADVYRHLTTGMFEPFILPGLEQAGYSVSFDSIRNKKSIAPEASGVMVNRPQKQDLELNLGFKSARLVGGGRIDLGGMVKGWSVDRLAKSLIQKGIRAGMLSAGGDLYVWGGNDHSPWEVDVEDPWDLTKSAATVRLNQGAVATSSVLGRKWETGKGTMHHLIDPRTMASASTDAVQCTVVGDNALECEIYAKVILILGSKEGVDWFLQTTAGHHFEVLLITDNEEKIYAGSKENWKTHWAGVEPDQFYYR